MSANHESMPKPLLSVIRDSHSKCEQSSQLHRKLNLDLIAAPHSAKVARKSLIVKAYCSQSFNW